MRHSTWALGLIGFFLALPVGAQDYAYARPPCPYHDPTPIVDSPTEASWESAQWRDRELALFRVHVGGIGRFSEDLATPGLTTALDIGRGPAGFRLSGAWLQVGSPHGMAQYSGEMTLDLGGTSRWRPVLGAGAGVARMRFESEEKTEALTLGFGLIRMGLEYRIPLENTDTRAGVGIVGVLPALQRQDSPDQSPWILATATLGVGF